MKASRVGRRALRGGRHAARAVARRKMPIAAFGVLAATVVGLGALTAADIQSMDELGNRPGPSGWHQPGPHHRLDPHPGEQQFREIPDWMPPGPH